jgi:UrcA family protein
MKTPIRRVLPTVMLLTSVWVVPGAFAEEPLRSETVKFPDLNVDTPAGAQALYSRIHAAAKRVCEQRDPVMQAAVLPCIRKAEANAVQYLNLPQLTAYYRGKTGNQSQPIIAQR